MCFNTNLISLKGVRNLNGLRGAAGTPYSVDLFSKCGKCLECQSEKAHGWLVRSTFEYLSNPGQPSCFITLSYADNPVVLIRRDFTLFLKRFRKAISPTKIRYFAVGQYGERFLRPHYHAVIFGWNDLDAVYTGLSKRGNALYLSKTLAAVWPYGDVVYQPFSEKELNYTCAYSTKNYGLSRSLLDEPIYVSRKEKQRFDKNALLRSHLDARRIAEFTTAIKDGKEFFKEKHASFEHQRYSLSLGLKYFEEHYDEIKQTFTYYINGYPYLIPSQWIIKKALQGCPYALKEMTSRETLNMTISEHSRLKGLKETATMNKSNKKFDLDYE